MAHRNDPVYRSLLRAEALENTWEARTDVILRTLDALPPPLVQGSVRIKKAVSE